MKLYNLKNISLIILFTFIIFKFFNTPYNIYSILLSNYEKRMTKAYGFCENESWGFYNLVIKKFDLKNKEIKIIHDEDNITLESLTNLKRSDRNVKYLMVLNYQSKNDENIYDSDYDFIKKYKTIHRSNNCYLMVRK